MQPLATILSFLALTVPLLLHAQNHEFDADGVASFFHNDSLPVSCNVRLGIDPYHGDMISNPIENFDSPGECCSLCRNRTGCRAWTWRNEQKQCWLKHTANPLRPCPTCVCGVLHDVVPGICNPIEGRSLSGPNLEVRIGTTVGDCCDACYQTEGCEGWTFNNTNSPRCFLKESIERETTCMDCTSGENEHRRRPDEACNAQRNVSWYGHNFPGTPYVNVGEAGCCEMCRGNGTGCKAWVYRISLQHCYLKFEVGDVENCSNCIGGIFE